MPRDRSASASESRHVETLVPVAQANSDVVDALQQESLYSAAYVGSDRKAWEPELEAARANTDTVLAQAVPRLQDDLGGTPVRSSRRPSWPSAPRTSSTYYRDSVDQGFRSDQIHELVVNYGDLEDTFAAVNTNVADALSDPQAASDLRTAGALRPTSPPSPARAPCSAGSAERGSFGSDKAFDLYQKALAAEASELSLLNQAGGHRHARAPCATPWPPTRAPRSTPLRDAAPTRWAPRATSTPTARPSPGPPSTVIKDLHTVEAGAHPGPHRRDASRPVPAPSGPRTCSWSPPSLAIGRRGHRRRLPRPPDHPAAAPASPRPPTACPTEQMPRLIESLQEPVRGRAGLPARAR